MARGFSLLELLVATAVGSLLLGIVVFALNRSTLAARLHQDSQLITEDLRAALGLISDYVNWSLAVYPPGVQIQLGSDQAYTVRNPRTGGGTWVVGTDPILAVILPPLDPTASCSQASNQGCFRFAAFYLLSRSHVVQNAQGAANPGADPLNDGNARLLYIYQRALETWPPQGGGSGGDGGNNRLQLLNPDLSFPDSVSGARGFLLSDYVVDFTVNYVRCFNGGSPGACASGQTGLRTLAFSASQLEIVLRAYRAYRWPRPGVEVFLSQGAAPRNLVLLAR